MIDLLANIVYTGVLLAAGMVSTTELDVPSTGVHPVTFKEVAPMWKTPCQFSGVVVSFEKLWEDREVVDGFERVIPAEPGKVAGQAILLNKKTCPDKEPETVLKEGANWGRSFRLYNGRKVITSNVKSLTDPDGPKWLSQVVAKIEEAASKGNEDAKSFLALSAPEKLPVEKTPEPVTEPAAPETTAEPSPDTVVTVTAGTPE